MVFVLILFSGILGIVVLDNAFTGGFKRRSGLDKISEVAIKSREYKTELDIPIEKKIFSFDGTLLSGFLYKAKKQSHNKTGKIFHRIKNA